MTKRIIDFSDPEIYVDWILEYTEALYNPDIRYIFLKGSAGAGKSVVCSQLTLQEVLEGQDYAWIRKIRATVKNSCYQALYNQAKSWDLFEDIEFQKSLHAQSKISDGKILFLGLDDPEKIKSLADLDRIVCEEATDLTFDDFTQLDIRLRGRKNQKLIALFNPISDQHWLKTQVKDNPNWDWQKTVWIEKTVLDNKFADEQYIQSLKKLEQTNLEMFKVYFLNEWGQSQKGLIFSKFDISNNEFEPETAGLDFGYNDPSVLVYAKVSDVFNEPKKKLQLREVLYETGLTESTLITKFEQLKVSKTLKIYADGSRPELINALQKAGYNVVSATKGAGSVYRGILSLKEYDIELVDSPNGTKEFQNYCWIEKGGTILDQEPKGGFDHCFVGETLITTNKGQIPIKDIKAGDLILTRKGYKRCLRVWQNGFKECFKYRITSNRIKKEIICTPNHKFWTEKNGFIEINKIKQDKLCILHKNSMEKFIDFIPMKNTTQEVIKDFIEKFGNFIMEKYQKGMIYTIKTVIQKIIQLKIWKWLKEVNIIKNIGNKKHQSKFNGIETILPTMLDRKRSNGISLKQGESGTKNIMKSFEINFKRNILKRIVSNVKNVLNPKHFITDSVQTNVNQNGEESKELIIFNNSAESAIKYLKKTDIVKLYIVPADVQVLEETSSSQEVYDLTVEDEHEYFANDILVHNCIDASRYAITHYLSSPLILPTTKLSYSNFEF